MRPQDAIQVLQDLSLCFALLPLPPDPFTDICTDDEKKHLLLMLSLMLMSLLLMRLRTAENYNWCFAIIS